MSQHISVDTGVVMRAGLVVLELEVTPDAGNERMRAVHPMSARGARMMARQLNELADDADAWRAPDERDEALDEMGVTRLGDGGPSAEPPKRSRKRKSRGRE
ncbi:MAG TPA: hypothetical protein VK550_12430 [Polyangiaceae bacterium]|nr:hypothetical protein [Polyangiaceae bacterium]